MGLILTNAKRIAEAIWEDTNIEGARKRLFNVKMHMPYKEWCAVQIEYNTWAYTDSKAKLKTLMKFSTNHYWYN